MGNSAEVSREQQEKIVKDALIQLIANHRNEFEQLIREGKSK
jgi:hypothetical protein